MSEIAEEKVFKFFFELPEKARMEVFNEMQPDDRCRLTRCSKQSYIEAKPSSLKALSIYAPSKNQISICAEFRYYKSNDFMLKTQRIGFKIDIKHEWEKKHMTYESLGLRRTQFWRVELDNSTNIVELASQIFRDQLEYHQKSIKLLSFYGINDMHFVSNVDQYESLEDLTLGKGIDAHKIFSKLTRPLKILNTSGRNDLVNCEEIYQVKDHLMSHDLKLNNEQFNRLNASKVHIDIGKLTEMDIFHFVKAWQRGEVRENFDICSWKISNTVFNAQELFSKFDVQMEDFEKHSWFSTKIVHDKDPSKIAKLSVSGKVGRGYLTFAVELPTSSAF